MFKSFKKPIFFALAAAAIIGAGHFATTRAADDFVVERNILSQKGLKRKMVDQGDGTYAVATAPGVASSTAPYKSGGSGLITSAPVSVSTGVPVTSWLFMVQGGSATFRVNSGDQIFATKTFPGFADECKPLCQAPTIDVDFLEAGATAQVVFGVAQ